jgi:Dyp-type peroxidase family
VRPVNQSELQGNILCGYGRGYRHGVFLFFRIDDPRDFSRWLAAHLGSITTAVRWDHPPDSTLNVALSFTGLDRMGLRFEVLASFPPDFREGMEARAGRLGDTGESDPGRWDKSLKGLHGVLTCVARTCPARNERREELKAEAQEAGVTIVCEQDTDVSKNEREHFGFVDGISQPAVDDPNAGPWKRPGDVPVKPGEFVLGYMDEGGVIARAPKVIGANGSYMVVRKLEQNVEGFWDFIRKEAGPDRMEWLAAKMVGRWPEGIPLVQSPHVPGRSKADRDRGRLNDFTYSGDSNGYRCPIGAHIRRANPRDSLDPEWQFANRHRIIRRGMPYTANDGTEERGLMFACFQASIERQFEFVQSQWMGDGNAFGLGSDPDFIAGPSEGKMTIQGSPPRFVPMRSFITTRGGEYFFAPGIAALQHLAGMH